MHRVHIFTRNETDLERTLQLLLVKVNVMIGGGRAPPTLTSLG
jgi:hypothetical protein